MDPRPIRFYMFTFENVNTGKRFVNGAEGTSPCNAKAIAIPKMERYIAQKPELGDPSCYKLIEQECVGLVPSPELQIGHSV